MRPKVIMHTQISLDGCIRGFQPAAGYYIAADQMQTDMVLFGSETVRLAAETYPPEPRQAMRRPAVKPNDERQIWVVPDSRGILRNLHVFRDTPYCKDLLLLVSSKTPREYIEYLEQREYDYISVGDNHVDLAEALRVLYEKYACRTLRTDSGGILTSVLLEQGLVDEISLIVSPCLVGTREPTVFRSLRLPQNMALKLISCEPLGGELSLRYSVLA